ncbi:MAG TPA: (deoxy)nucleoside triphosphate pyrophosphohydrolase, partial [bacterium]|nr:(deoxy)nucleoside triphosphate pyrophosphohydrolase [bacterium]
RVTAAIIRRKGKILLARRKPGKPMGSKWEFPGGKIGPGESPEECLERELKEEFSVEARIGELIGAIRFTNRDVRLHIFVYRVRVSGEFTLNEHEAIRWVLPDSILDYNLVDSDGVVARELLTPR